MGKITGKYAIVGVGINERSKKSGKTPLRLANEAAHLAIADAGLEPGEVDGFLSYQEMDSCDGHSLATSLGIRPTYYNDVLGGGSSTEMLVADAIGLIEAGVVNTVLIFRAMNGRSGLRMGGGGGWEPQQLMNLFPGGSYLIPYGVSTPGQLFGLVANRHMHETGTTEEHLGAVCETFYAHAQLNDTARFYGRPLTVADYLDTPYLSYPFRIHDYCTETDEGNAIIVTSAERARDLKQKPVYIEGVAGRNCVPNSFQYGLDDITEVGGVYAGPQVFGMAGVSPSDIEVAAIYDCFSWVVLAQLEAYGFVGRGEAGSFVAEGGLKLGGKLPANTAGGMLSEGYTHGMNNIIELVRQLRHDYAGTQRQVENASLGMSTGWGGPSTASAMILRS